MKHFPDRFGAEDKRLSPRDMAELRPVRRLRFLRISSVRNKNELGLRWLPEARRSGALV